jgi:hypothetical protein
MQVKIKRVSGIQFYISNYIEAPIYHPEYFRLRRSVILNTLPGQCSAEEMFRGDQPGRLGTSKGWFRNAASDDMQA